jgi:hypothetical protein
VIPHRPYHNVPSSGVVVFDGLQAVCWFVSMTSNITMPRVINTAPGQLYTFVFTQDAVGGHVMNWPSNCHNAASIDPAPGATTVQNFVGNTGGVLEPDTSSSWS